MKLTCRNQIVLLDFGLAKGAAVGMSITGPTASVFGYTPSYAPLEQIQGSGTDAKSDLYSLAATVYHLLTSTKPVDALTRATTLVNGRADPLAPASEVNPHIPCAVSDVLMQAMALKRDERPSSAAEMRCMLRDALRPATESQSTKPRQANTAVRLDPSTEALTIARTTPNKTMADPVTHSSRPSLSQNRSAPLGAYRGPNRSPMVTQAQWQSSAAAFQDQTDSSRGKLIVAAVIFIVAIAVIVYALNRRSNAGDANVTQTGINSNSQVKDSNQPDANVKTPAASSSDSNPGWPSAIREQASGEEKPSSTGDDNTAREEQGQEPEQTETKRAETGAEPEKADAAKSRPERGQEEANREHRPPPPPPPPPMEHGPPPDHGPPPGGMPPPPPPRRRP